MRYMVHLGEVSKTLTFFCHFSEKIQGTPLYKYKEGGLRIFSAKFWTVRHTLAE